MDNTIKQGRKFFNFDNSKKCIILEWCFLSKNFGINLSFGTQESAISIGIHMIFLSLWLSLDWHKFECWISNKIKRKDENYGSGRENSIRIDDWIVWISIWSDPMESRGTDPWWNNFTIDIPKILFGAAERKVEILENGDCTIIMPEKRYVATYEKILHIITRKRLDWTGVGRRVFAFDVRIKGGIPVPGKGTCSHNCGDDSISAFYISAAQDQSVHSVCRDQAISILRTRQKYESLDWLP